MSHRAVALASRLYIIRVHARRWSSCKSPLARLLAAIVIHVLDVECVDMPRYVAQNGQADVDEQILKHPASAWNSEENKAGDVGLPIPHPATAQTPMGGTENMLVTVDLPEITKVRVTYRGW